jgi:hypothetical protein
MEVFLDPETNVLMPVPFPREPFSYDEDDGFV